MISEIIIKISTCYQDDLGQDSESGKCYVLPKENLSSLWGVLRKTLFQLLSFGWGKALTD